MEKYCLLFTLLFWPSTLFKVCIALRNISFEVPQSIAIGASVSLYCNFDLENDDLYSVKWYKNDVEFYRYLPSDVPPGQQFRLKGIHVDTVRSNVSHAYLYYTDLDSEGEYGCEVSSTDTFDTLRAKKQMKVFALPIDGLRIEGSEPSYSKQTNVNITCISGASFPAANLSWRINEQKALQSQLVNYATEMNDTLMIAKLGLSFHASPNYFNRGVLRLQCLSEVTLVYQFESMLKYSGGMATNKSDGENMWHSATVNGVKMDEETPVIHGGKQRYLDGDLMELNCSTEFQDLVLKWFVKNDEANETQYVRYSIENGVRNGHFEKKSTTILGLRLRVTKKHLRMQELKIRCVATRRKTIADPSQTLTIKTVENDDRLRVQPNTENYANFTIAVNPGFAFVDIVLLWICVWTHYY